MTADNRRAATDNPDGALDDVLVTIEGIDHNGASFRPVHIHTFRLPSE